MFKPPNMQTEPTIDWPKAIERNQVALLRIVASLFAMLGLSETAFNERISRSLRNAILRILRPAEAAVRRLIFVAAKDIEVKPSLSKPLPKDKKIPKGDGSKPRRPLFQLSDNRGVIEPQTRRKFAKVGPRISNFDDWKPNPNVVPKRAPRPKDGLASANRLLQRLLAIKDALENIPKHANRLARWKARRRRQSKTRLVFTIPIKTGPPPFYSEKSTHEVHEILRVCHHLAWEVRTPDTS
jgi:hypothetical protein